jgi:thiamine transport system permease protein
VLVVGIFFAWPLVTVLRRAVSPAGTAVLASGETWQVMRFTLVQASLSTVLTLLAGLPAAYVLHRLAFRGRRAVLSVLTVPFVLPTVVVGAAFRTLLPEPWIGTLGAILLAHVFFNVAIVVRVVGGLWTHLDTRYEQAARTLGAAPWTVFRTVTWPLLRPAVLAAAALVFLFTFTSFGVVLVLGGPTTRTIEVAIYQRTMGLFDLAGAAALCALQVVAVLAVLLVAGHLQRRLAVRQRLARGEVAAHPVRTRGDRLWLGLVLLESTLVLLPVLSLLASSLRVGDHWGLDWWRALGATGTSTRDVEVWDAVRVSLGYCAAAVIITVVVGGLAACAIAYARRGSSVLLDSALTLPLGTSAVTIGFGLLLTFSRPPFDLRASWIIVPIGQALVAIPLVVRTVLPVLRALDPRLREVAATLGASPVQSWRSVDLPVLARVLAVGAGFAAAVSLGEFGATSFLARATSPTVPVAIAELLERPGEANVGRAAALSVVLVAMTAVAVLVTDHLRVPGSGGL